MQNFGPKNTPRLWFSQRIAQPQFLNLRRGVFLLILLFSSAAYAQSKQSQDQINQPTVFPTNAPPVFIPEVGFWDRVGKNLHGGYSVSYMGPRIAGVYNETYNIYLEDASPVQLFHGVQLSYKVNPDLEIGIKDSAVQNLADGIVSKTGLVYQRDFIIYDPSVFFDLPNLIQVPGWFVSNNVSFSLSVTEASNNIGKITMIDWFQSWSLNTNGSPWSFAINLELIPKFYTEPKPLGFNNRQTLFFSVGHFLSYRLAPEFAIQTSTSFDWDHRAPDPQGAMHFGSNLPDTFKLSCVYTPQTSGVFLSFGAYFQSLIINPSTETSIVGADFAISF